MFQPQEMSQVELEVSESDVLPVTEALADLSAFHQIDTSHLRTGDEARSTEHWQERIAAFTTLERRVLNVMGELEISEAELPPPTKVHPIEPEVVRTALENLEEKMQATVRELQEKRERVEELQHYISLLKPLQGLEVNIEELRTLRYVFAVLGTIPHQNLERLRTSLRRVPSVLAELRRDDHTAVVALFGRQRDSDVLERAARSAYLNPIDLPKGYRGTPAEIMEALNTGIERSRRQTIEYREEIEELRQAHIPQLRTLLWRLRGSRALAEAITKFGRLHSTYLILGWVPTRQLQRLRHELEHVSDEVLIETRQVDRQETEEEVPTALSNPPFLQGFQQLVTNYGAPRYNEIDPTPILALTFPLMFGIMFGDVGHGLVLALLGLLLASGRVRSLPSRTGGQRQGVGLLVGVCGLASVVFGFLYGSVFGLEHILSPIWLRPLENITDMLLASVAVGVLLLNVGFICNLINAWLIRDWGRLLFSTSGLAGILLYWSLIGLLASVSMAALSLPSTIFAVTAMIGGVGIAFSEPLGELIGREGPPEGGGIVQGLFELLEMVISFMSNSLSYVRMGVFAVAHSGLSAVVFILAGLLSPSHGPLYWLVVALGNLAVIGFEGLIVGIQAMRLEYYEFFTKFFTGGGVSFHPLTMVKSG
ncbi:MAG: V-type ATPase 116kDa subunit family protein [Chloroflexota bacterium]|nr:V-type ATPase 116kDa subunit family protein [Chloroflexota bacterium]